MGELCHSSISLGINTRRMFGPMRVQFVMIALVAVVCSCSRVDLISLKENRWRESGGAYIRGVVVFSGDSLNGFYLQPDLGVRYNGAFVGTVIRADKDFMIIKTPKGDRAEFTSF